jgi:hypothetical protein
MRRSIITEARKQQSPSDSQGSKNAMEAFIAEVRSANNRLNCWKTSANIAILLDPAQPKAATRYTNDDPHTFAGSWKKSAPILGLPGIIKESTNSP